MSECILEENMDAYVKLTDDVIHHILLHSDPQLKKSQQLVQDLWRRKLYMFVAESQPTQKRRYTCVRISYVLCYRLSCWYRFQQREEIRLSVTVGISERPLACVTDKDTYTHTHTHLIKGNEKALKKHEL